MAKRNDYITGREDGLLMALEIVKNEGVEALEKEIEFRNVTGIRTALAKKDINRATIKIKEQTVDTVTILSVATLHDEASEHKDATDLLRGLTKRRNASWMTWQAGTII